MATITDVLPLLGVRISAGPLELRGLTDEHLVSLGELARRGVHAPDEMPFEQPWSLAPPEDHALNMAQFHWGLRSRFSPEAWTLALGVWWEGELVGSQGLSATHYLTTRTGETGSWLGLAHHGRGIGTRMRQAICAFAFDHLDAAELTSGAWVDNPSSRAVSRKVGYVENGTTRKQRRDGEVVGHVALRLTPQAFVRGEPIEVQGGAAFRRSIGLDAPAVPDADG